MTLMKRWSFGDFVFDLDTHELRRAGRPVSLSPKAFQLLGILVESRARALSKAELQARLWPGTFVVEKNLTNLVSEIRAALDDPAEQPGFIRTVHRFGYAFCEAAASEDQTGDARIGSESTTHSSVLDARHHNLPVPLTNFVGRCQEIARLQRLVASTRLLTLTGAGGCGKTRLALELAGSLLDHFPDGVWWVDFAPLSDPNLLEQSVASALGVREGPTRPIRESVTGYVRGRQLLLVLDNCEHMIAACAHLVETLLQTGRRLSILATSREGLRISGETIWRVPSLSVPEPLQLVPVDALLQYDAIDLFVERASAVDPGFTVTETNAPAIASICHRLDGIPLAIELAAARVNVLSVEQIGDRLNDRFRLLTGGARTTVARQRTLKAAVDWSYDLLSDSERELLRRLSVFAGGWTLEAAEKVTSSVGSGAEGVLDLLSRLVDKSLVNVDGDNAAIRRYRFLETVRQYARDRLLQSGEAGHSRDGHLTCFRELAQRADPELNGAGQIAWLNRLQLELDNLREALEWALADPARGDQSLDLASALLWFWVKRGYLREGQEWLERALSASRTPSSTLRAKALTSLGCLTFFQGDLARTRELLDESASLGRACGDLGAIGFALGMNALAALELGDITAGARLAAEGRDAARASTRPWLQGPSLTCLAYLAMHEGDLVCAGQLHEEALEVSRGHGEKWGVATSLTDLALLRVVQQRHGQARTLCAEGISLYREFGDRLGIAWCLGILSAAESADGHAVRAARLWGAMEGLLESVGAPLQAVYKRWIGDRYLDPMKESLGESAYRAAVAEGRGISLPAAIQLGLLVSSRGDEVG
jgi:non-specific serine/threonine protein kinase